MAADRFPVNGRAPTVDRAEAAALERALRRSPIIAPILERWAAVQLPQGWLVAGAVAQTVWNLAHGHAAETGIRDVDLVYFDSDLAAETEQRHEARLRALFANIDAKFDVKNEARVHLWYAAKFGTPIPPYTSVEAAIATFPTTATAIGVRPGASGLEVCAPFGLTDLLELVVRPNKAQITQAVYETKIERWRQHWPKLRISAWEDATT